MKNRFGEITQPHISFKKARVLELLMFYDTRKILSKFLRFWVVSFIQWSEITSVLII